MFLLINIYLPQNQNNMIVNRNFPVCGNCSQKEQKSNLKKGCYYCRYALDIFANGIVTEDIDATECVNKGYYLPYQ